jgi:hypothetical protein
MNHGSAKVPNVIEELLVLPDNLFGQFLDSVLNFGCAFRKIRFHTVSVQV